MKKSYLYYGAALVGIASLYAGILAAGVGESTSTAATTPVRKPQSSDVVKKPEAASAWVLKCDGVGGRKQCIVVQELRTKKENQLVLQMEVRADSANAATGALTLPFGVSVTEGVSLQVDSGPDIRLPFNTCLPQGCLVPLKLDTSVISAMRRGEKIKLTAFVPGGSTVSFEMTLQGFSEEYSRMLEQNSTPAS